MRSSFVTFLSVAWSRVSEYLLIRLHLCSLSSLSQLLHLLQVIRWFQIFMWASLSVFHCVYGSSSILTLLDFVIVLKASLIHLLCVIPLNHVLVAIVPIFFKKVVDLWALEQFTVHVDTPTADARIVYRWSTFVWILLREQLWLRANASSKASCLMILILHATAVMVRRCGYAATAIIRSYFIICCAMISCVAHPWANIFHRAHIRVSYRAMLF